MDARNAGEATVERVPCATLLASRSPRERKSATAALVTSVAFHGALVAGLVWATLAVGKPVEEPEDPFVVLPVEREPAPPAPLPPPPPPDVPVPPKVAEVPFGHQTLVPPTIVPPEIPPPSTGPITREMDYSGLGSEGGRGDGRAPERPVTVEDVETAPVFTPFTVRPELKNRAEVARALERFYPPLLRDAGVGGTAVVWFLIDEDGRVVKTQLKASSGHDTLDRAALDVGNLMRFTPALNRDQRVKVWIELPVLFTAR
ncbi:MAG TPA: energy transducer TonB [Longimicrobiales bacterium]|nr:energy transducer TonB [Longimicrobiales bacterium]